MEIQIDIKSDEEIIENLGGFFQSQLESQFPGLYTTVVVKHESC